LEISGVSVKTKPILVVWGAALMVALIAVGLIWWRHRDLYLASDKGPPNRARSYGTGRYVSDIRLGWCNNDGKVIAHNFFTDSLSVTVFLQNFDGWLLAQGNNEPRLLPSDLKPEELKNYDSLTTLKGTSTKLTPEQEAQLQTLQSKINHWITQERANLRLMIAGHVFVTIPPFDATAPPTYGTGEFAGETYNRVVFHLEAPKDPDELETWRSIIRAVGTDCGAQISVARPITGRSDALRIPTLVNADAIYGRGANSVHRSLPLVPPMRQAAAAIAVIFTIAAIVSAGVGTRALRDGRGLGLAQNKEPPWSLARIVFAWWLAICVGSFAYLWALMGEHRNILSKTVPLLLGIQGTTMVISAGVARTRTARASQGFFNDLISEKGEPEVSRLQMLVWNVVLGVVFIWQSVFEWKMPEFDATLMTLLGISSTAYLGFKFVTK
jgi:hypothetical protein